MNPEEHDTPERPVPPSAGPQAERVVANILAELNDVDTEQRIIEGFLTHGAGFAAFLRLQDTAPHEPILIHRYEQCYAGAWKRLDDLANDTLEALGWAEELSALKTREGIPDDYLTWNHAAIYGRLHDMYSFVELDGLTHAFHR